MIELSGGSLPSSSPVVLGPNEWLKYQCGEDHTLSGIPDSSDLFTVTCLDDDHTMTHCKPVQCGDPSVIAHTTPLGGCFVTITYGKQAEYQCGSKSKGCHAKERQAPEEPVGAVSSCGHVDPLEKRFASWIGQQVRPFPSQSSSALLSDLRDAQPVDLQPRRVWAQFYEWLEDWSCGRCDEMSQWAVLATGPPGTGKTAGVRLLAREVRGTFLECDMREVEGRKLVELILKGQGGQGLRQTSAAILNIGTDVTDGLKWRLCKAAQLSQITLILVCDDGIVTAWNELVQRCLCLEVRHESQNVEQALQRMTLRNGLNMPEACLSIAIACGHDVRQAISTAQLLGQRSASSELPTADMSASAACHQLRLPSDATDVPEALELLEQDGEELCQALRQYLTSCGKSFETLDGCAFAPLIATLSAKTGLPKGRLGQPLDRSQSRGGQDGSLLVTNSSPTELASKVVAQDDTDELDRSWEEHWIPAEEHEDIQVDVTFADDAWNENAAVFEQKDPLDTVLALDADDAASDDEVAKKAEAAAVEGKVVETLRDVAAEEVLVPARGATPTGWRVDRFPQGPGRMRLVSTPLWSLRPPTCEPELWLTIGKAAQREMRAKWQADDPEARWCGRLRSRGWEGRATWIEFRWRWTRLFIASPLQFEQFLLTPLFRVMVVSWLSVLAAAMPLLRLSYSKLEHFF